MKTVEQVQIELCELFKQLKELVETCGVDNDKTRDVINHAIKFLDNFDTNEKNNTI